MKLALVSTFLLAVAVNATEETLRDIIAGETQAEDLEALDSEETSSRRRRRRRRWSHSHSPHSHAPHSHAPHSHKPSIGCTNNKVWNCKCNIASNSYSDALIFNQCNKGGGNLSGEQDIPSDLKGKWGVAVWSQDYKNKSPIPDGGNVCGKKKNWYSSKRTNNCKCGCFNKDALGSSGGFSPKTGYNTKCLGVCGPQCDGLKKANQKRFPSIIIHDACQASINNKDDYFKGGVFNQCGDEGLHASTAAALSAVQGQC